MNWERLIKLELSVAGMTYCTAIMARNPIIQTIYTADPAPIVWHDTVFLFTGHDEDKTAPVKGITGTHDVFFLFKGEKQLFNFDWRKLNGK